MKIVNKSGKNRIRSLISNKIGKLKKAHINQVKRIRGFIKKKLSKIRHFNK